MQIEIDTAREIVKVEGVAYSFGFFTALSRSGIEEGEHFFIERREEIDGTTKVRIGRISPVRVGETATGLQTLVLKTLEKSDG